MPYEAILTRLPRIRRGSPPIGSFGIIANNKKTVHQSEFFSNLLGDGRESTRISKLPMDATLFRERLADLGLSQTEAAKLLGLSRWTLVRYANGRPIPPPVAIRLKVGR